MTIPRIVHGVWFDFGAGPVPPARYDAMRASVVRHTQGWERMMWDRPMCDALIASDFAWFLPSWLGLKADIYRVDAIRPFILYARGGVYLDTDVTLLRDLDPIRFDPDGTPRGVLLPNVLESGRRLSNFVLGAEAGHPFLAYVLGEMHRASRSPILNLRTSWLTTICLAGPFRWQQSLTDYRYGRCTSEDLENERIMVLPSYAFMHKGATAATAANHDFCYGVHHYHSSWGSATKLAADGVRVLAILAAALALVLVFRSTR